MSSRYNWICLTHDPAMIINSPEYQSFNEITGVIANDDRPELHQQCDLVVGRWSGGLTELVCIGCKYHGSSYQKWISKDWLVLLHRVWQYNRDTLTTTVTVGISIPYNLTRCWHPDRLRKLGSLLES